MKKNKKTDNCRFPIDFFEFSFLVEACIPPKPIARSMFWDSVINKHYYSMTLEERSHLYSWITKNWVFQDGIKNNNEDCQLFEARFNPDNQYCVTTNHKNKITGYDCFLWKDNYHTSKSTSILKEYIIDIIKK